VRKLKNYLRFLAAVQLLPALESGEETLVGGQAVLEGVMMRSPHAWAIACRKPSGEVVTMSEPLERPSEKHKWMAWPIVRGVMTLGYAMNLGYRALRFSANVAIEDDCRRIVDAAREKFGPVTILVNNAGHYGPVVPVEEYPLTDFDEVIAVHLRAAFLLSQLVLPEMYEHEHGLFSTFPVCRPRLLFRGVLPTLPPKPACWA